MSVGPPCVTLKFISQCCMLPDQALEYQMQQGMAEGAAQALYLVPRSALHSYGPRLAGGACTLRLLEVT